MAIAALAGLCATAAAANVLVVRSSGPSARSFPPGRSLAPQARVTLRQGDTIVLLDGRGTRTLRGPGSFAAGAAAQVTTRSALTVSNNGRIGRVGASRSTPPTARPPSLWHVDVSQGGTYCLADARAIQLWRPSAIRTAAVTIAPASGGASPRTVSWSAGQATLAWPTDLGIAAGGDYRVSVEGAAPTLVRFRVLPSAPVDRQAQAAAFIANGCQAQLDLLLETIQQPA